MSTDFGESMTSAAGSAASALALPAAPGALAYAEVVQWSHDLPGWQRDALRRLATTASLTEADIEQLAEACKAESNQQPLPCPLLPIDDMHVPTCGRAASVVTICGVTAGHSLNAIPDGQSLTFGTTGLTVVYGDNGTGKSGYSRVLRNACHARGTADAVLPNIYAGQRETPSAMVDYQVNGNPSTFSWTQGGSPSPEELRAVAIFDSSAASTLIEKENEVLWTPGGVDLLVRLAAVIDLVRERLQQAARAVSMPGPLPQVPNRTSAAAMLARLSISTTAADLDAVTLRNEEQQELARLDVALATPDPTVASTQLRQRAQRFRTLRDRLARIEAVLSEEGLRKLTERRNAYQTSADAEALLASTTFGDSLVPGVGSGPWRMLWDAAEHYASSGATPDGVFPSAAWPDLCVLCQQPLSDDARGRLRRFHSFVRADVATRKASEAEALRNKIGEIQCLRVREPTDDPLIEELIALHAENARNLSTFLDAARSAVTTIAGLGLEATQWRLPAPLPVGWAAWLDSVAGETEQQATAMLQVAAPDQRSIMASRRLELQARQAFSRGRPLVEAEVQRLIRRNALERAIAACATTGITRKAGELTRVYVSNHLMEAFQAEARALRLSLTVRYCHSRNEKGTSYQRVILDAAPWAERAGTPIRVLSEGERRAVALAAFLAELAAREDRSGVVLDDPVSSLDHERRRVVATRLVQLAQERQVVVFTHDLVFLHMLRTAAGEAGIAVTDREVRRNWTACGVCREKPPVKAMGIRSLVGELKERQQGCAASHRAGQMDEYEVQLANAYGLLREGWERAVEELLLNQTVMRFDHRVQTQRLKYLCDITETDLAEIDAGMTVCSKWLPGHALAPAMNEPLPEPAELLSEIQRLESFVQAMRRRGRS